MDSVCEPLNPGKIAGISEVGTVGSQRMSDQELAGGCALERGSKSGEIHLNRYRQGLMAQQAVVCREAGGAIFLPVKGDVDGSSLLKMPCEHGALERRVWLPNGKCDDAM